MFSPTGKILNRLNKENFTLLDENKPRTIENCVLDRNRIHVAIPLDVSRSIHSEIKQISDAAHTFIRSFGKEDRFTVISFSDRVEVLQNWTSSIKMVRCALKKLQYGYRTALYDALWSTINQQFANISGKKEIIILTDGIDNESTRTYEDVLRRLLSSNIALYIISRTRLVQDEVTKINRVNFLNNVMSNLVEGKEDFIEIYFREKEAAMSHMAEATGGQAFYPRILEEINRTYVELAQELKSQYLLTFRPPTTLALAFRKIEVYCNVANGKILHRKKYYWQQIQ